MPRDGLVRALPGDRVAGWVGPLVVTAFAALLRFYRLATPGTTVFDEVYYRHDSYNLLTHGVELSTDNRGPGFVVHPPLGKWMIAAGQWLFGNTPFGWRFSAAVVGTLSVLILARTARRLFGSTLLGCLAGLLLALDGLEFVQSRVAMLDIFLMFWIVAALACMVADRDDGRRRLAARATPGSRFGPWLGVRWWRAGAGVCLGASIACKWSGAPFLLAFFLLAHLWDGSARRVAGVRAPRRGALLRDGLPSLVPFAVIPAAVYLASWTGWFLGGANTAWDHDKYVHPGQGPLAHVVALFRGWIAYHQEVLNFHIHLSAGHPYKSTPLTWLFLGRPVAYYYSAPVRGHAGCAVAHCSREVLAIGTPALWWGAIPALAYVIWRWVARRDWRSGLVLAGFAAGYLFWVPFPERTMFLFYALPAVPFMTLAVTQTAGALLGGLAGSVQRVRAGAAVAGAYALVVVACFAFFYPVLTAATIPTSAWNARMWFTQCTNPDPKQHTVEVAPCWI